VLYTENLANFNVAKMTADAKLVSTTLGSAETARLTSYLNAASAASVPVRITETNNACNGGVAGVSNAFASALWVIDYLLIGATRGIAGMNFHGGLNTLCSGYTVLCRVGSSNNYTVAPIYYGMLFTRMLGIGQFLPVTVTPSVKTENLAAFALKPTTGTGTRVMLESLGSQAVSTKLQLSGYTGKASLLSLTGGGSPLATSGIAIQGASVTADGKLAPGSAASVSCTSSGCPVTLQPYTAVLLSS
jgi:hypothetical protein